mmetsp:Transcript_67246/g.161168  ORF Transcript_67246/g.161168 Transcript_67246/m.161168 type:complete len:737 (-) Transcript_67246:105-2315(-)
MDSVVAEIQEVRRRQDLQEKEQQQHGELLKEHKVRLYAMQELVDQLLAQSPIPDERSSKAADAELPQLDPQLMKKFSLDVSSDAADVAGSETRWHLSHTRQPTLPCDSDLSAIEPAPAAPIRTSRRCMTPTATFSEHQDLEEEDPMGEKRSCWDAASFIWHSDVMSGGESVCILLLVLLTLLMQFGFLGVVNTSLTKPAIDEEEIEGFQKWRLLAAHREDLVDSLSFESMASRVCREDPSLHLSQKQVQTVEEINKYLYDNYPFNGPLMCGLAIVAWLLVVFREYHGLMDRLRLLYFLPKSGTIIRLGLSARDLSLTAVSRARGSWMLSLLFLRFVIAASLMGAGAKFMSYTLSLPELIMNAIALEFVLKIDEMVFICFAPHRTRATMKIMKPMRLPRRLECKEVDLQVILGFIAMIVILVIHIYCFLAPHIALLSDAYEELCGGNQHFAFAVTEAGFPIWADLDVHGQEFDDLKKMTRYRVLKDVVTTPFGTRVSNETERYQTLSFFGSQWSLRSMAIWDIDEWGARLNPQCADHLTPEKRIQNSPDFWYSLASVRDVSGNQTLMYCDEVLASCDDATELGTYTRLACPVACGCRSPLSTLVLGTMEFGCASTCFDHHEYQSALAEAPCEELAKPELVQHPSWRARLDRLQIATLTWPFTASNIFAVLMQIMEEHGCGAVEIAQQQLSWNLCSHEGSIRAITVLCPVTCGCTGVGAMVNVSKMDCPGRCQAALAH